VIGAHEFRERFGYWMDRAAAGDGLIVTRYGKPVVQVSRTR
jgi:prevent-host-death family protein